MNTVFVNGVQYEYATRWQRFLGQFLDGLIYTAIVFIPAMILGAFLRENLVVVIAMLPALWYLLFQDGMPGGQSLGKKGVDTRVIDARTGRPCSYGQSFLRNLSLIVLSWIDWIFIFGEKHQRLGDKLAGTVVVKA